MNADKLADVLRADIRRCLDDVATEFRAYGRDETRFVQLIARMDAQPAQAAQPVGVADGWVMVPRQDFETVFYAGFDRDTVTRTEEQIIDAARDRLEKALCAPQPPAQPSADAEDAAYAERVACLACVPTSWLDPLLSGPEAVVTTGRILPKHIEALLRGIRDRIAARAARPLE